MIYKVILNTLGNLTILKGGKNASLGNKGWLEKRDRFSTGSYNEIDISNREIWTKREIYLRGIDMLSLLENKISSLHFSEDEKLKFLFYNESITNKFFN